MKNDQRGRRSWVGLMMVAILLAATAGYVSALSRMFQSPMPIMSEQSDFHFDAEADTHADNERAAATYDQSFSRTAPAWFVNAMPAYSSGRAREMWYLSLNSSADRELSLERATTGYNLVGDRYKFSSSSFFTNPFVSAGGFGESLTAPSAPLVASTYTWSTSTAGTAWIRSSNWTGGPANTYPGVDLNASTIGDGDPGDIAQFSTLAFTGNSVGINFGSGTGNGTTANGGANGQLTLGAIVILNTMSKNLAIGKNDGSTITADLVLNGATVNSIANTILRNADDNLFTIAEFAGGSGTPMRLVLGNATDNIINIDSTGGITVGTAIAGSGKNLTFNGTSTGVLTLSGVNANTYNGLTTVNVGEMDLSKTAGGNAIAGNLTIGDGVGAPNSATVKLTNINQIADTSDVTINSDGVFNLNNNSETIDALNGTVGSSVTLGSGTLTVGANNEPGANFHGVISGTGGFIKTGIGTQILSGTNTYSGDTQILAGDLRFDGGGTSNSSTIRLGDTSGSNSATLSLGVGSGNNVASPLEVRAGSTGTKVLRSVADSGTNTYSGAITLNTGLTLEAISNGGVTSSTLLLQGGSVDVKTNTLTVDTQVNLNGANSVNAQGTVIINEVLGSSSTTGGALVKDGSNTLILQGTNNTYTGTDPSALNANGTTIKDGVLGIYGDGSLGLAPTNATNNVFFATSSLGAATNTPTLQDTSGDVTLAVTRNINIASGVTARFDSNGNTFTIAGNVNGAGNLTKIGPGTLVLSGANTYTGTTTINAGTLNAAAFSALGGTSSVTVNGGGTLLLSNPDTINRIADNASMVLNGGTLNTGGLSEYTVGSVLPGMGSLTLQSSSIIDLANGSSILAFANSALQTGNWNGTLSIYNWSGTVLTGNGTDQLYFGTDATGLTPAQLAQISFYSDSGQTFLGFGSWGTDLDGEVVPLAPVPEPSTWIGAALALGAIGFVSRRRLRATKS